MSQNDFSIANQTSSALRLDLNNALQALASLSSGSSAPTTTYANMLWYDTGANLLKMRTEADDGWITIAYLDQGAGAFRILDDTQVVNTSGTQTGLIGDQATETWEAGTGTTPSLVSPASVKAAIESLAKSLGVNQSWQSVSRSVGTIYQNTTGSPIEVYCKLTRSSSDCVTYGYVSSNNLTFIEVSSGASTNIDGASVNFTVPNLYYYKVTGVGTSGVGAWAELR